MFSLYPQGGNLSDRLPKDILVESSNDNINFDMVFDGKIDSSNYVWHDIILDKSSNEKYWRLTFKNSFSGDYTAVGEMKIYVLD